MAEIRNLQVREVFYPEDSLFLEAAQLLDVTFHSGHSKRHISALHEWRQKQRLLDQTNRFRNVGAVFEEQLVGIGSVRIPKVPGKYFATIENVAVASDYRRQGVGRHIIGALERIALESDALGVTLSPTTAAVPFYRSLGYEEADLWKLSKQF